MARLSITVAEHEREMQELAHAYEIKLDALRLELSKSRAAAQVTEQTKNSVAVASAQTQKRK